MTIETKDFLKKVSNFFLNGVLLGLIGFGLIAIGLDEAYYRFAPTSHWIEIEKIEIADTIKGSNTTLTYNYRNTKKPVSANYEYKIRCGNTSYLGTLGPVVLEKTNGFEIHDGGIILGKDLAVGKCKAHIKAIIDIGKGHTRNIFLKSNFTIYDR